MPQPPINLTPTCDDTYRGRSFREIQNLCFNFIYVSFFFFLIFSFSAALAIDKTSRGKLACTNPDKFTGNEKIFKPERKITEKGPLLKRRGKKMSNEMKTDRPRFSVKRIGEERGKGK